ncbi:hypothetical protein PRIPAC_73289 [Pristionchus pacificus]|uniref:Uncharacterized protein n=1 Tax=Pristionchus pacificus TaxID=54126 RepID=A0A2A6C6N0_PRIPA|nr:hypothetical protein PRIPAC_73289 [Pristionchus pacificus]|eukprot:PDM73819.1 hypothetical protein PRIPAC_41175 [Pristionchus pacificus]
MSGAESSPPTPRAGFRDPAPVEYRISRDLLSVTKVHYRPFADTARLPPVPLLPSPVSPSSRPPPASPSSYRPLSLPVDCASAASSFLTGELHHYGRFPNDDHYYTYVVKGRSGGGARLNGFLVGALVGLCTGAWWQRRYCHDGHASARMTKNDYSDPNAIQSKDTSIQ